MAHTLAPDYESEEFTHVPDWIPRPVNVVSVRAKDASLRSDGFVEGELSYVFSEEETMWEMIRHLGTTGLSADTGGRVFSSEDPPRRAELRIDAAPDGGITVVLMYQGTDHGKSCNCHTCTGLPDPGF